MSSTCVNKARKLVAQVYPHKKFMTIGPEQIAKWNAAVCDVVRKCIVDTGSACHLAGENCLSSREREERQLSQASISRCKLRMVCQRSTKHSD